MQPVVLDERLSRAAALFPACAYGADIGADHGRLSCYLLEKGICQRMCVADISAESLQKARTLLALRGLDARADFAVGDGLQVLKERAQAIAILGMGGRTLSDILRQGREKLQGAALILSAHTEIQLVRRQLVALNYRLHTEEVVQSGGRFYVLMRAVPGDERYSDRQLYLGPRLTEGCGALYLNYLRWRVGVISRKRTEEARRELDWLKEEEERVRNCENR